MNVRFFILFSFCFLLFSSLSVKLYGVQVKKGEYYTSRAMAREVYLDEQSARRGQIYFVDRSGTKIPVALNRDYPMVYAVPKEVVDPQRASMLLGTLFQKDVGVLKSAFQNKRSLFRIVKEKVTAEEIAQVKALKIPGVYVGKRESRLYPFESFASRMLGFVGLKDDADAPAGLYGLEKEYEEQLAKGNDISLSIDRNVQAQSEQMLKSLITKYSAAQGSVIIADPKTGKIVSMATLPDFNPNAYGASPVDRFTNPVISGVYESGSVFKPITMAIGIESGAITPETAFVDSGSVTLNGKTIRNWDLKAHGRVTMTNVIEQSINTGTVFAESRIGHKRFLDYVKRFGFGESTQLSRTDEIRGSIKNLEKKEIRDIDYATAAFGQGTAVTPIQLVKAFGAIANGGLLMKPSLLLDEEPHVVSRVVKKETAQAVSLMMESALSKAQVARIPNYRMAGKTGTAQIPDFRRGGYSEEYNHTYIGFGPVSDPRFLIFIRLEKPNVTLAGQTVVPAFRELAEYLIGYYHIPPDALADSLIAGDKSAR